MGSTSRARRAASAVALGMTLILAAVGCRQPTGPVGTYRVTTIYHVDDGELLLETVPPGITITLEFTNDGRVSGQVCNSYGGSWAPAGRGFRVTGLFSTDMACAQPEGIMRVETVFLDKLDEVGSVQRRGNTVTFGSPGEPSYPIFEAQRV